MTSTERIIDRLAALADPTRGRLLLVLERYELAVAELTAILQLPQSSVSRHLKVLVDGGWLAARAEGTSRLYRLEGELDGSAADLWAAVRADFAALPVAQEDALRTASVLAQRALRSQEFFRGAAGEWDTLRTELFGARVDLWSLLALLDENWVVGDLGCGTGQVSASLAPFVARVVAVDNSPAMLAAARGRLAGAPQVEFRSGDLTALPLADAELDAAVLCLVLHHVAEPERALREAARCLKPGGRLLIVDMMPHERREYRDTMGHVWLGFRPEQLGAWLTNAGFAPPAHRALPPDPEGKGPPVFAASARRVAAATPQNSL